MDFAKLFKSDEHGQILLKTDVPEDSSNGDHELRIFFDPEIEWAGVCSVGIYFDDDDGEEGREASEKAAEAMQRIDQEKAEAIVSETKTHALNL